MALNTQTRNDVVSVYVQIMMGPVVLHIVDNSRANCWPDHSGHPLSVET